MKYVDSKKMKQIDNYCINQLGISGMILMENAAIKIFNEVDEKLKEMPNSKVIIISGVGNNGGDGLALSRHLYLHNYNVEVFIVGNLKKASNDFNENFQIIKNINKLDDNKIGIRFINENTDLNKLQSLIYADVIIDGIFGTGLKRKISGIYESLILKVNKCSAYTIAIDIPSGINGDNGEVMGVAIKADETITLQLPKVGFLKEHISEYCGNIKVVDIGIPRKVIQIL
ncbi:NAD(P)H-hydrate epimerase [Clostridium senegalense]|uniref:NAD(P)H-hydrate epimerase n=1 Tax=Clostridium senegalense TaxID=1465809 RepID=UPI001C10E31F|nr:NAD(P)H-hydrate epimerase [Clostridium senegalense]MBU5225937.1 NAD(P)H-hydrate epimerase [Clostridium senegalense]